MSASDFWTIRLNTAGQPQIPEIAQLVTADYFMTLQITTDQIKF